MPDHLRCRRVSGSFANFEWLGMGSSSVAYRARRLSDDREVVLKALRRRGTGEAISAKREFALLSELKHPNIIVALGFLESPSCVALVLEYVVGRNLRSVLRSTPMGRLDELGTMRLLAQAAAGLAYLHGREIVHRDLKPENLLISTEGLLKIIDFNVSSSVEGGELLTPTGTREFRAPEVMDVPYTSSADVWSVGLCVYFMLHGRTPARNGAASAAADVDASGGVPGSDDDVGTPRAPPVRQTTEQPFCAWGGSRWALQRCLRKDWRERATAQELLEGASCWLAGH